MIDFVLLPIPPPQESLMKRFISLFVVVVLSFSICTFAFALEDIPEFDSDFIRYAPSSGSFNVGSETKSIVVPWTVVSSSGYQAVSSIDASCNAIGNLHGHFTFVLIIGSSSVPATITNVRSVSIETIDSSTNLHYYHSTLRPTNYRFSYNHYITADNPKSFSCIPFICEFDIPDDETFTTLYSDDANVIMRVNGDYTSAAFFLYSSTRNSVIDHLKDIENYCSVFPDYVEYVEQYLSDIEYNTHLSADKVSGIYNFYSSVSSRYNTSTSRGATWDNMPNTTNPFYAIADIMHALINDKAHSTFKTSDLVELDELQTDVIVTASDGLPSFVHGISKFMSFFDVSSVNAPLEFDDSFLGYEDYWGNVPFFFSSDIDLGVQNAS